MVVRLGAPYLPIEQKRAVAAVWRDSLDRPGKEAVPAAAALSRGAIAREKEEKNIPNSKQIPAISRVDFKSEWATGRPATATVARGESRWNQQLERRPGTDECDGIAAVTAQGPHSTMASRTMYLG